MERIKRYLNLCKIIYITNLKSSMIYRTNFVLSICSNIALIIFQFILLHLTVGRINSLGDWSYCEVLMIYGFYQLVMGLYSFFGSGISTISDGLCYDGRLDRLLLRPYSALFQIMIENLRLDALIGCLSGLALFIWGYLDYELSITLAFVLRCTVALLSSYCFVVAIYLSICSIGFWLNEKFSIQDSLSLVMLFGQYPTNIYSKPLFCIITFLLPVSFVGFFPVLFILQHPFLNPVYNFYPFVCLVFLSISIIIWKKGLRRYESIS